MKKIIILFILLITIFSCADYNFDNPNDRLNIDYSAPLINASRGKVGEIELEWKTRQKNISEYIVYKGTNKNKLNELVRVPANKQFFIDNDFNATENNKYYYAVETLLSSGEKTKRSNTAEGYIYHTVITFPDIGLESAVRDTINKRNSDIYAGDVAGIIVLNASGRKIFNLSGIEYLFSLNKLNLDNNILNNISPLISLSELKELIISNNNINDLTSLVDNKNIGDNLILYLNNNPLNDEAKNRQIPSLKSRGVNVIDTISFIDQELEDIVRQKISKPIGEIYTSDITRLISLDLSDTNISNFDGLYQLSFMTNLHLSNNNLSDLSMLWYLNGLKDLFLKNNNISDINVLSNLSELKVLDLTNNNIDNIDTLTSLYKLEVVILINNNISDISALINNSGLGNSDTVVLIENPLSDDAVNIQIPILKDRGVNVYY